MSPLVFPLLFALSTIAIWLPFKFDCFGKSIRLWWIIFMASLALGWYLAYVELTGIVFIAIYFALVICYRAYQNIIWLRRLFFSCVVIASLLLGFHLAPGFNALVLIEESTVSSATHAYSNWFNLDKYLVGIAVVGFILPVATRWADWKNVFIYALKGLAIASVVIFPLGVLLDALGLDVKAPDFLAIWVVSNLIFTCVTEEAFFRGLIQKRLQYACEKLPFGHYWAISFTALFFGVVHFRFGLSYIVLATIAGFIYGWVYYKTDKIEAAILTHFGLNFLHIIFFTYPLK